MRQQKNKMFPIFCLILDKKQSGKQFSEAVPVNFELFDRGPQIPIQIADAFGTSVLPRKQVKCRALTPKDGTGRF